MNKLIKRLRSELAKTTEKNRQAELLALIAANLARQGKFEEAHRSVGLARDLFANGRSDVGTLWIMLAEGLLQFFEHQSLQALDRIARSQVLAIAMQQPNLVATASAWKAHIEFENSYFEAMITSLKLARQNADESNHDAHARFAMVLFNSFTICGQSDVAQVWFLRAHTHAVSNGDQASIEALLYNRAAFTIGRMRVENCAAELDEFSLRRIRTDLTSSTNLTAIVDSAALSNYPVFIGARLSMLEGNYEEAITKLQAIRHQSPFASNNFDQAYVDLELCYCNFRLGRADLVSEYLAADHQRAFPDLDIDEQIVAAWMLWQMSLSDPRFGDSPAMQARFEELHGGYTRSRASLLQSLQPFMR